ncbi:hypothetical protein [Laspinema olomoucense]|uniref:Uncharacterized protein n=1 Tax=Laspinema olomoucense D3b TaxID=2953688 RepID=A0ABT2N691_9CYAN|nr:MULTISPECIES: hypothetical protein [unclassified Laspinema]MCT7973362.1 hypothetical protein [Laspinema sp. D3d]MCT7977250.1 hypothetical protein [Laspinema sp. D3b]MCT7989899.1 hypothetical protein [Laspinema sp. D3a]MCT7995541.1 hypothetical protein [Laspinema sp. D3c]
MSRTPGAIAWGLGSSSHKKADLSLSAENYLTDLKDIESMALAVPRRSPLGFG